MVPGFNSGYFSGYELSPMSLSSVDRKVTTWHRIIEAFKFAYAKRSKIGDGDVENAKFNEELAEVCVFSYVLSTFYFTVIW